MSGVVLSMHDMNGNKQVCMSWDLWACQHQVCGAVLGSGENKRLEHDMLPLE